MIAVEALLMVLCTVMVHMKQNGIATTADNDCNVGALSELWGGGMGRRERPGDFVFLSIGDLGVGGGIVLGA